MGMITFAKEVATLRSDHQPTATQVDRATPQEVALFYAHTLVHLDICTLVHLCLLRPPVGYSKQSLGSTPMTSRQVEDKQLFRKNHL